MRASLFNSEKSIIPIRISGLRLQKSVLVFSFISKLTYRSGNPARLRFMDLVGSCLGANRIKANSERRLGAYFLTLAP